MKAHSIFRYALLSAMALGYARAAEPPGWISNGTPASGYSVEYVKASPQPGTKLLAGTKLQIHVTVNYKLTVAKAGKLLLVVQDDTNKSLSAIDAGALRAVNSPAGSAELTTSIDVPANAKEVRVFVPLMPDGLSDSKGELRLRYPIAAH